MTQNPCYQLPFFEIYNECGVNGLSRIADNSVDCILTDPPYLYLKNQKLDKDFDESKYFNECKRILKNDGFIVLFGRGTSFYRWNTKLSELGFKFKEEIIWDKCRTSSPVNPIGRKHETISIHSKNLGKIKKVRVNFFEKYKYEPEKIARTINRLATTFGNRLTFDLLKKYYETGHKEYNSSVDGHCVTRAKNSTKSLNRTIDFAVALEEGVTEQSIIKQVGVHYDTIHPTQKPVDLLIRLLNLTTNEGDLVVDSFSGSCSTGIACMKSNRRFMGFEIDNEYFYKSVERVKQYENESGLFKGCW